MLEQKKGDYPNCFIPVEIEKCEQKKIEINALDYIECSSMKYYTVVYKILKRYKKWKHFFKNF